MLLGIVGLNGSGKDTVADYLVEKYGFVHYGCGQAVRDELLRLGKNHLDRNEMIDHANKMRKEKGNDYWPKFIFEKFKDNERLIISSIRNPSEIDFIESKRGFLIRVDAEQKLRFSRISKRATDKPTQHGEVDFDDFCKKEDRELASADPSKQQLTECLKRASIVLDNSGNLIELQRKVDESMQKLMDSGGVE
jgi:dephospho-CoA kinase